MTSRERSRLREWRKAKKLTLQQVSERIGLSVPQLSRIEKGSTAGVKRHVVERLVEMSEGALTPADVMDPSHS
jgi:transcriptional regulator with XRE-family HTH domain